MTDIRYFRDAELKIGANRIIFVVEAGIGETWESISGPKYLDSDNKFIHPTLRQFRIYIRRRFDPDDGLHTLLDGSGGTIDFTSQGYSIRFSNAVVEKWHVTGVEKEELREEFTLLCGEMEIL